MDNKLINTLKTAGLTENEANTYLAAMSLGPTSIQKIAQTAEVKRTTVYSVVEALKQKGLMREELKGWKKLFVAENPDRLEYMVERMKVGIQKVLPEFNALYNFQSSGAFIKYYEGVEAVKSVYDGLIKDIKPHEDYLIISDLRGWLDQDQEFFLDFTKRRAKLNINIRMLLRESDVAYEHKKREMEFNEKIKIVPKNFELTTNLVIIPNRVVINQVKPPYFAMVIENESIIKMHREMFEMIWRSLP